MSREYCDILVFLNTHSELNDDSLIISFITKLSNDRATRMLKNSGVPEECIAPALIIKAEVAQTGTLNHQVVIDLFAKYKYDVSRSYLINHDPRQVRIVKKIDLEKIITLMRKPAQ